MIKQINIAILESKLKDDNISPLRKCFIWEMLRELKGK